MRVRLNIMMRRGMWVGVGLLILLTHTITAAEPKHVHVLVLHSFGREFAPFSVFANQFRTELAEQSPVPVADLSRTTAGVAVRILQGESPASFRPAPLGPGKPVFDWRELRRWGIRESDLPPGSVVQFHQPTFWELYRWQIAGTVALVLLQIALIISLLSNRTKRRQGEAEAILIADISSKFVNLPANEVDREIMEAERRICEFLGLDVAALWQWLGESTDFFTLTHYSAQKGPQPPERMNAKEHFPWFQQQMLAGRIVAVSSLAELPAEAARDRESARQLGIKSNLTIPLTVGGEPPIGVLGLNTTRAERDWPDALVKRLQLVAQIFANALARKRSDQALRASEELSRVTFEQAAVGIAHVGIDGRWLRVNDKLCAIVGYQRDELLQLNFRDITHPADLDANLNYVRQLLAGEIQTCTLEKRYLRKDRSVVWINMALSLVRTGTGQPKYFISVVEDITARRESEQELQRLRVQLWHADRVTQTGAIAASLAHEINQPLAAILSNAQAGLRFMAGPNLNLEEIREILTDIVRDDKRAGAVISGLRGLLQRKTTQRETLGLPGTIQEILDLLHGELLDRHIEVHLQLEADCLVVVDKTQIQQVILNLVMNAVEAMQHQPAGQRQLQVTLTRPSAGEARVTVCDSGPGIHGEQQEKLFEAFWTTKEQGMGIGLPISRSIIESHGGRIWFVNNTDRGVTFYFALPCQVDHSTGVK